MTTFSPFCRARGFALALLLAAPLAATAQFEAPAVLVQPSTLAKVYQQVGLTDITVEYSSPSLRGRTAFGAAGVVPFDKLWRAGANKNPQITTTHALSIGGKELPAGTYSILMMPRQSGTWTVIFNKFLLGWGEGNYQESEDALRVEVAPITVQEKLENLTYYFADRTDDRVNLVLGWDNVRVPVPMTVDLEKIAVASAKDQLRGLQQFSWVGTAQIAGFLHSRGWAPDVAKEAVDKSIAINANATNLGLKARMALKAGNQADFAATNQRILDMARSENDLAPYLNGLMAERHLDQALAVATEAGKKYKDSWRPLVWQAQVLNLQGKKAEAKALAEKGLAKAPADAKPRVEAILKQIGA